MPQAEVQQTPTWVKALVLNLRRDQTRQHVCRVAVGMLGALCGANKVCSSELWKVCEQKPECVHDIWHLRREQGQISELQVIR